MKAEDVQDLIKLSKLQQKNQELKYMIHLLGGRRP